MSRIYLDNAATSWPKPEEVYRAVDRFQREVGASHGRGAYGSALSCARIVDDARRGLAELLGERDPSRVVFTGGGTDSLSLAIRGTLREGDHVVTTVLEHNAVLRTLHALRADATHVGIDASGRVDPGEIAAALRPDTRMVIATHASNVTGVVQPVEPIAAAVRQHPALLLVDAAQTAGRWPLEVSGLGADFVAAPGHKGLLGPLGVGFLWIREGVPRLPAPLRHGGTGANSDSTEMPDTLPARFEAGSLNTPAIAGLGAAVRLLLETGVESLRARTTAAADRLAGSLREIEGVQTYGRDRAAPNAGVVAFNLRGYDPHDVASALEAMAGVECRAGLHCAPLAHQALGSAPRGGVRFSPGVTTSDKEIDTALDAVATLARTPPS